MSKVKTKKIVSKRFKISKNGAVRHRVQGARHLRSKKSAAHKRRQDKAKTLTNNKLVQRIRRFMET